MSTDSNYGENDIIYRNAEEKDFDLVAEMEKAWKMAQDYKDQLFQKGPPITCQTIVQVSSVKPKTQQIGFHVPKPKRQVQMDTLISAIPFGEVDPDQRDNDNQGSKYQ